MKPSFSKSGLHSFTTGTVTCHFCNSSFTTGTEQFHYRHRQFHYRYRFLNLLRPKARDEDAEDCIRESVSVLAWELPHA